jgi:hypothetical protein
MRNNYLNKTNDSANSDKNGIKALKYVMAFVLLLCSIAAGLTVELVIAGANIIYWTFAERGLWLLLWTAITYAIMFLFSKDMFIAKDNRVVEGENI